MGYCIAEKRDTGEGEEGRKKGKGGEKRGAREKG